MTRAVAPSSGRRSTARETDIRLRALEEDMRLVKHLLGNPAA